MDEQESDDITIELQDSPNVVGSDVEDLILSPLEECDSGYLEQQVNGSVTSDPKHYAASNPLVRLPPELDRYVIKPVHADGATLGSATAMELTSDGAEGLLLADDGNVDETNIASGLAQVAELDELLERQIECERFARFYRLLHAQENDLPLTVKESCELEKLQAHIANTDPQFAEAVFKTQAARVRASQAADLAVLGDQEELMQASTGPEVQQHHQISSVSLPASHSQATLGDVNDDDDVTNFVQRNIDHVVEAGNVIKLTDSEHARLDELLADDDPNDGSDEEGSGTALAQARSETSTTDGDERSKKAPTPLALKEAEVNRIIIRPPLKNAYRVGQSQQQRLQMIDSHLQHLSAGALTHESTSQLPSMLSLRSSERVSRSASNETSSPDLSLSGVDCGDGSEAMPRLTEEQLQALLAQCREEQRLQSSSALSDVRHSAVPSHVVHLAVEEYDSAPEDIDGTDSQE